MKRKGEMLIENVVFIILNILFISILIVFLMNQSSGQINMEKNYAKEIALIVDSASPGMVITLNMKDALKVVEEKNYPFENILDFSNHEVTVKLGESSSYGYHYFNDVKVNSYPEQDESDKYTGNYILVVSIK